MKRAGGLRVSGMRAWLGLLLAALMSATPASGQVERSKSTKWFIIRWTPTEAYLVRDASFEQVEPRVYELTYYRVSRTDPAGNRKWRIRLNCPANTSRILGYDSVGPGMESLPKEKWVYDQKIQVQDAGLLSRTICRQLFGMVLSGPW